MSVIYDVVDLLNEQKQYDVRVNNGNRQAMSQKQLDIALSECRPFDPITCTPLGKVTYSLLRDSNAELLNDHDAKTISYPSMVVTSAGKLLQLMEGNSQTVLAH